MLIRKCSFDELEMDLKLVLIQTFKMTYQLNSRFKFKSVLEYLPDVSEYDVYRCMQNIYNKKNINESYHCIGEFTSQKFNLHTSKIYPFVNVPYDKIVNVRVLADNVNSYKNYDLVQCIICNTTVGCVYNGTIALCKNVYRTTLATLIEYERPMQPSSIADNLPHRMADWSFNRANMPRNLRAWDMQRILEENRNEAHYQRKARKDFPFLLKYLKNELQGPKSYSDFVMVSFNHIFFVFINLNNFFFHRDLNIVIPT